ncbi:ester cyclase [Phenylobacterium sp.]|uniref:ester cyclase n=1 Tax=Phenylobacterium sp. TaxID=1871053 RepID=UPI002737DBD9|nr:nuclear transport factor 2 family protein [Phenylobacterium sp.]MDP3870675.1 nuclear transport factor 2 family protein [Phenylobacterium sp.]
MTDKLRAAREKTVRDHMRLENELDFDAVMQTFATPRYELFGQGTVIEGDEAVRGYFRRSRTPFPDQSNEIIALRQDGDAVLVEFWLLGTHKGPMVVKGQTIEPTGKAFKVRMMAVFEFAGDSDKIVCERPYFDQQAIWAQLGVG